MACNIVYCTTRRRTRCIRKSWFSISYEKLQVTRAAESTVCIETSISTGSTLRRIRPLMTKGGRSLFCKAANGKDRSMPVEDAWSQEPLSDGTGTSATGRELVRRDERSPSSGRASAVRPTQRKRAGCTVFRSQSTGGSGAMTEPSPPQPPSSNGFRRDRRPEPARLPFALEAAPGRQRPEQRTLGAFYDGPRSLEQPRRWRREGWPCPGVRLDTYRTAR